MAECSRTEHIEEPAQVARVSFFGYPIDTPSMQAAIDAIERLIRARIPSYIVAINPAKLWRMERDPRLARVVAGASLLLPEKAIVIGARILGIPIRHHVGGSMVLQAFLPVAARRGFRLYFLGARREAVGRLVAKLNQDYPALEIAGWHDGYLSAEDDHRVTEEIRELRPDVLFVAMGTPKQELWIAGHLDRLGVPVCMGVGGSFDVLSGLKKDAPGWVRSIAMEWFFRLIQDPRNLWKRYLTTMPWFLHRILRRVIQRVLARERTETADVS